VTIDQQGRFYRCNSLLGHPEFAIGDARHDEFNETQKEFRDLDVWKQCPVDCAYLPMCSGGCRLMSFVGGNKNFKVVSCKKDYLNEMAPEFIKRDYDRMLAQKHDIEKQSVMV
ncbi:MAG: SPASM domain-containing protein, partial [Candidatus Omnitrophica bacterium]|nr:SPASM domain-containing protein [Candidatus Omnitrophota bacterium]